MRGAEQGQAGCKERGRGDFVALQHGDFPDKKSKRGLGRRRIIDRI